VATAATEELLVACPRQNGEGSVYHRASDGMWIGSVTLGWDSDKRVRKTGVVTAFGGSA
jgi:hypothetical protein